MTMFCTVGPRCLMRSSRGSATPDRTHRSSLCCGFHDILQCNTRPHNGAMLLFFDSILLCFVAGSMAHLQTVQLLRRLQKSSRRVQSPLQSRVSYSVFDGRRLIPSRSSFQLLLWLARPAIKYQRTPGRK